MFSLDQMISLSLKAALDFNSAVVVLCTVWAGRLMTPEEFNNFKREYDRLAKDYQQKLQEIFKDAVS